jgi:polysaccharide deacetylase family protein (PEP-CTERM system associated)
LNILTVDVEDYFHVSAFANNIRRDAWDTYECRVEHNTNALLDLFDRRAVKATFFVLGWVAERYPSLVQEIVRRGHEVASHGFSHQLVYEQDPATFRDETRRSKQLIEDIAQVPVRGYRAASYSITKKSLWALDILCELGFEYDSSIYPVYHDRYGIPDACREPHICTAPNGASIAELPLSYFNLAGARVPISGGGYFRLFPYWFTRACIQSINKKDRLPVIFYLHPWEIDTQQPRVRASLLSRFRHYNNLEKCYQRMDKLLSDFEFVTASEYLDSSGLLKHINREGRAA